MKIKASRIISLITALCCIAGVSSCGRDVPKTSEDSQDGFVVNSNEGSEASEEGETSARATIPDTTENLTESTETTATGGNAAFVTRSKEELSDLKKPTGSSGTSTTAKPNTPTGGNTGTSGGNGNSGTGTGTGSGNTGTGTGTGTGNSKKLTLSYYTAEIVVGQTKTYPLVSETINEIWTSSNTSVATVDRIGNITGVGEGTCTIRVTSADDSSLYAEVKVTVTAASSGNQQIDGVTYINGILIANKSYGLPSTYNPGGLTSDTYSAFQELVQGASYDGITIYLSSGFRSYDLQSEIYNNYVNVNGQATADTFSARPGYSEHQTGLAIDVNEISDAFIGTPEAIWLAEHCVEYGFIIRYPQGKQDITGYKYEPWHIRYVGKETAQALKNAADAAGDPNLTLEEWLGIDSYYH